MSWQTRIGVRLLFWIAETLVSEALKPEERDNLRAIAVSFGNGAWPTE